MNTNKKNKSPHVFLILFTLIIIACIMTYIIPSSTFDRIKDPVSNQTLVLPNSYKLLDKTPVMIWEIPLKFFQAITSKSIIQLIFFILIIGGSFEIIMQTSSIEFLFKKILSKLQNKRFLVIPIFITLFSILGFTMGLSTAAVIFVPIGILAAEMLNFGKLTGIAMVTLGANVGFAAGIFNPFSVGVAQSIAQVPLFSGAWIRWLLLIPLIISTSMYIIYYAKKYDISINQKNTLNPITFESKLSIKQIFVLIIFFSSFVLIVIGLSLWWWSVPNIGSLFFIVGVLCGIVYGFNGNKICDFFVIGARKMVTGIFVISLAATIRTILIDGQILDTIAYYIIGSVENFPKCTTLLGLFYGNAALDLLVTSGSGHAALAMPLMIPITDCLNISRQAAVFSFQLGDGLMNLTSPLSTTLTGVLAVSNISYSKWIRFFLPLVIIYLLIGTAFIFLATIVGY